MDSGNERRRYIITSSLISWAHTQNYCGNDMQLYATQNTYDQYNAMEFPATKQNECSKYDTIEKKTPCDMGMFSCIWMIFCLLSLGSFRSVKSNLSDEFIFLRIWVDIYLCVFPNGVHVGQDVKIFAVNEFDKTTTTTTTNKSDVAIRILSILVVDITCNREWPILFSVE